jgi:hypothetical protein
LLFLVSETVGAKIFEKASDLVVSWLSVLLRKIGFVQTALVVLQMKIDLRLYQWNDLRSLEV